MDNGLNCLLEHNDLEKANEEFYIYWEQFKDNKEMIYTKADLEEHLIEDKLLFGARREWDCLRAKGPLLLQEFQEQVMPLIKRVIKIQIEGTIKNDTNDEIVYKGDFIAEMHNGWIVLFDNKTSSVKFDKDSVKTSEQLATYFEALKEEYGLTHAGYIVIPKKTNKKKKPIVNIEVIIDKIDEKTIDKTFEMYQNTLDNIKEGKFDKNWNNCINKYGRCPYYDFCRSGSKKGLTEK